jgi:hypothetical protein
MEDKHDQKSGQDEDGRGICLERAKSRKRNQASKGKRSLAEMQNKPVGQNKSYRRDYFASGAAISRPL